MKIVNSENQEIRKQIPESTVNRFKDIFAVEAEPMWTVTLEEYKLYEDEVLSMRAEMLALELNNTALPSCPLESEPEPEPEQIRRRKALAFGKLNPSWGKNLRDQFRSTGSHIYEAAAQLGAGMTPGKVYSRYEIVKLMGPHGSDNFCTTMVTRDIIQRCRKDGILL